MSSDSVSSRTISRPAAHTLTDATTMWVTGQEQRLADEVGEDRAIAEIEEELKSLDQALEELKVVD